MAEYGRDWSRRRGRGWRSRRGFAHDDDFERRAEPYGIGRPRRGRRPYFTGFRREPGIEEGFGYGAGVGMTEYDYEFGPERGRRRRKLAYPPDYQYDEPFQYGESFRRQPFERSARGYPPPYRRRRGGYSAHHDPRHSSYYGREFTRYEEFEPYSEDYYPGAEFGPREYRRTEPRYGHTPTDRWPSDGHDIEAEEELHFDDREVREAVLENLFQDSWIDPERIDVHVDGGVVTLTGEVRDFMEARYAWDDAWESPGVRGVINNLTVRADLPQEGMELPQTTGRELDDYRRR